MSVQEQLYRQYLEPLDRYPQYRGDVLRWIKENFMDVDYVINSRGTLSGVILLSEFGRGRMVELYIKGKDVEIRIHEYGKNPEVIEVYHPEARNILEDLAPYIESKIHFA